MEKKNFQNCINSTLGPSACVWGTSCWFLIKFVVDLYSGCRSCAPTEELTVRKNLLSESLNKTATELKKAEKDLRSVEKHTQDVTDKREEIDTEIDEVNVQVSNFCFCQCVSTFYPL